jgi:nucleoside-diphosphate-sugar epimerase
VNVSIVSPTVVYGLSVGQRVPITVRDIVATVKQLSMGFTMGDGRNIMGYIHVDDLADIYVRLVADAIKEPAERDSRLWGQQAYYFATGEEMSFAAYMKSLVELLKMKSMIKSKVVKDFRVVGSAEEQELVANVAETHGCGMSVRCRSERAETLLSWKVRGPSFLDTLPEVLGVL